jgi:hypothetical protein
MQWENVYVFISSTFNDMHAERDYLVKRVFPGLSAWCEDRKLRLIDIDLRWGVSEADATKNKRVLKVCLDRIDESRPFFLCFMGQRRGWVPKHDEISEATFRDFKKLNDEKYVGTASVTEMEILHALIDPLHYGLRKSDDGKETKCNPTEHAFFYLRKPDYLEELPESLRGIYTNIEEEDAYTADNELNKWREQTIPNSERPVTHYEASWIETSSTPEIALPYEVPTTAPEGSAEWEIAKHSWASAWHSQGIEVGDTGTIDDKKLESAKLRNNERTRGRLGNFSANDEELADIITAQLKDAITAKFGDRLEQNETKLQKELDQQAQFLQIAASGFIRRSGDFEALDAYISGNDNRPFAITAYAGMGKTSFLANYIDQHYLKSEEKETIHYRFIGVSDESANAEHLVFSILSELSDLKKITSSIPFDPNKMLTLFEMFLKESGSKGKTIIIIDALNQLESGMASLDWIPDSLPENVKLIVSFKRGDESAEKYYSQKEINKTMILHSIIPFESVDDRKKLVSAYLTQYFKELDDKRENDLVLSEGAENPLFLKTVLSELRVFGSHQNLSEVIKNSFGNTPALAFNAVLQRIESDPAYTNLSQDISVPHIFGWLVHSKNGLSVDELAELMIREKLTEDKNEAYESLYVVIRQLRPYLAKRDGRIDFFYESFKIASKERYTKIHPNAKGSKVWHKKIAEYFESKPHSDRHKCTELPYQYTMAEMWEEYFSLMTDYSFLNTRLLSFDINALLDDFSYIQNENTCGLSVEKADTLKLIKKALEAASPALIEDKAQLCSQLWARLKGSDHSKICELLSSASDSKLADSEAWIKLNNTSIARPDGSMMQIYRSMTEPVMIYEQNQVLVSIRTGEIDTLHRIDCETMQTIDKYKLGCIAKMTHIAGTEKIIYLNSTKKGFYIFDMQTRQSQILEGISYVPSALKYLAVCGDNILMAPYWKGSDSLDNTIYILSLTKQKDPQAIEPNRVDHIKYCKESGLLLIERKLDGAQYGESNIAAFAIEVWDVRAARCINTIELEDFFGKCNFIGSFTSSPDGKKLYVGVGFYLYEIDIEAGNLIRKYGLSSPLVLTTIAISKSGKYALLLGNKLSNGERHSITSLVDLSTGEEKRTLRKMETYGSVEVAFMPNDLSFLAQIDNRSIGEYSVPNCKLIRRHLRQGTHTNSLFITSDGRRAISYVGVAGESDNSFIHVIDLVAETPLDIGMEENIFYMKWLKDKIVCTGDSKYLRRYEPSTNQCEKLYELPAIPPYIEIEVSKDNSKIAVNIPRDQKRLWKVIDNETLDDVIEVFSSQKLGFANRTNTCIMPGNNLIITAENGDEIIVRDMQKNEILCTIKPEANTLTNILGLHNGKNLITLGYNSNYNEKADYDPYAPTIQMWDTATGACTNTFMNCSIAFLSGELSPDETILVCFSREAIMVFDVESGERIAIIPTPFIDGYSVKIACVNNDAFVVSDDHGISVFDINSKDCIARFRHDGKCEKILSDSDGNIFYLKNNFLETASIEGLEAAITKRKSGVSDGMSAEEKNILCLAIAEEAYGKGTEQLKLTNYDDAIEQFNISVEKYKESDRIKNQDTTKSQIAHVLSCLGQCYAAQKNTEDAEKSYLDCVRYYEMLLPTARAKHLTNLGKAYFNLGVIFWENDKSKALNYIQTSLVLREEIRTQDAQSEELYKQTLEWTERLKRLLEK